MTDLADLRGVVVLLDDDDDEGEGSDLGEREFVQLMGRHSIFFTEKIPRKITQTKTMEINQTDSEQHESL